ncbi:hypothetical protein FPQ18DRAFT_391967 [Pyronema domesticum]|nr:hypothetical protein FPQ18DRAFT_391967 [Pyronema domesticum]
MSIHDSWEDLPPTVTSYYSDDAAMEAGGGKDSKRTPIYLPSIPLPLQLEKSPNLACVHGIWEHWLPTVMRHCSDDAAMEAVFGKVSKVFL